VRHGDRLEGLLEAVRDTKSAVYRMESEAAVWYLPDGCKQGTIAQYSLGSNRQVLDLSASVMIQTLSSASPTG
jgi:hypothetical protein